MKEYTIIELYELLNKGEFTSKQLVQMYIDRIQRHDGYLNSLADMNIEALHIAEVLDEERRQNGPRSYLHGIPVVVKDNIFTHDSMRTTVNSYAFKDFYAPFDATIVKKLKDAGAIILAKANCSEFAYFMSMGKMPSGYGSMFGQVKHPYNSNIDPLGSSTGSAVSVAANLIPVSIGTETNGSLMSPAQQNSVVSLKPTLGLVSRHGIVPISRLQDTAGPMSRTVEDSAIVMDIIYGKDDNDIATHRIPDFSNSYYETLKNKPNIKRIGLLRFDNYPNDSEEEKILSEAKELFKSLNIEITDIEFTYNLPSNRITLQHEFKHEINAFLSSLSAYTNMRTLKDIIDYNKQQSLRCLRYGQVDLIQSEMTDGRLKDQTYLSLRKSLVQEVDMFKSLFDKYQIDAMITTKISGYPAIAGIPSMIVPAKPLIDLSPKSLILLGKEWQEHTLFNLAYYYEHQTQHRVPPKINCD